MLHLRERESKRGTRHELWLPAMYYNIDTFVVRLSVNPTAGADTTEPHQSVLAGLDN